MVPPTDDLEVFSKLAGQRQVIRASKSRQPDGTSVSEQIHDRNVLEVSELRRLPFGWSLVLFRKQYPIFLHLEEWPDRKDSKEIAAVDKLFARSLLEAEAAGQWEQAVTHQAGTSQGVVAAGNQVVAVSEQHQFHEAHLSIRGSVVEFKSGLTSGKGK